MNDLTVYWAQCSTDDREFTNLDLTAYQPESLLKYLSEARTNKNANFLKCGAVTGELKNTFIVRSSISYDLEKSFNDNGDLIQYNTNFSHQEFYSYFTQVNGDVVQFNDNKLFFCEEDLFVSQVPFSFDFDDKLRGIKLIPGKFNIGKWFRPIHPGFIMTENYVKVEMGKPFYCLKFHTDKKIKFKRFNARDPNIIKLVKETTSIKQSVEGLKLEALYELFTRSKKHKLIMKYIRANLLD